MTIDELRNRLQGIYPAVPTPLTPAGSLDEKGLRRLTAHLLEGGVHGLWVMGSGGSYVTYSPGERQAVIRVVLQETGGRIPVLAGAGECGTRKAIETLAAVADVGADAAFVTTPYYFIHDQAELRGYFDSIAEDSTLPFVVYNNPINTQNGLTVETVAYLARQERILGVKDSSCDFGFFQRLVQRLKSFPDFRIFQGGEFLVAPSLLLGADGAIFGLANVVPRLCVSLYRAAKNQDVNQVIQLQEDFLQVLEVEDIHGRGNDRSFLGGIQAALELLGICGRTLPKPFATFSLEEVRRVANILESKGIALDYSSVNS